MNNAKRDLAAPLRRVWLSRTPQERRALLAASLLLSLLLYGWLLQTSSASHRILQREVLILRTDAASLQQYAVELEQLLAMPLAPASELALLPLVQTSLADAGLADLLLQSEALDPDQVRLTFGAIPFDTWLRWVAALHAQNIQLVSTRIEALATSGLVSVTATLSRPGSR